MQLSPTECADSPCEGSPRDEVATVATSFSAATGLDVDAVGGAGGQITADFGAFGYGGGTGTVQPDDEVSLLMLGLKACDVGAVWQPKISALGGSANGSGSTPIIVIDEDEPIIVLEEDKVEGGISCKRKKELDKARGALILK